MLIIDQSIVVIHVRKGGGTAFCTSLIRDLPAERVDFFGYTRAGEARAAESRKAGGPWKHAKAAEAVKYLGRKPSAMYLVSVRPYLDRVGSYYKFAQRRFLRSPEAYAGLGDIDVHEFVRKPMVLQDRLDKYCLSSEGEQLVDHFVPFARLQETYSDLRAKLGLPEARLPVINKNPTGDTTYDTIFNADDRQFLDDAFEAERQMLTSLGMGVDGLPLA